MSVDIKKRFDRIVHILIQLQSKRIVKAQDLADRFEVSLRTIYRDIKSLEQAGVPLIGEAGSGYSIMDGYKLPPVSFNKEEALSFVATEKLAEKFLDKGTTEHFKSAMMKIKAILKTNDQDLMHSMQEQIIMKKQDSLIFQDQASQALRITLEAIAHQKQVQISYQGIKDEEGKIRIIEPIGVVHEIGYWYIVAYCITKSAFRQFRSDRIYFADLLDTNYSQKHISMDDFIKQNPSPEYPKTKVRISIDPEFAPFMRWERNHYGFITEKRNAGQIEMTFESRDIDHEFPRWLMMFADRIQILEPQELIENMEILWQKIQSNRNKH